MKKTQTVNLNYGTSRFPLEVMPSADLYRIREPEKTLNQAVFRQRLLKALAQSSPDLSRTAIVVGDKTRLCGYAEYLPIVLDTLVQLGSSQKEIRIYIAYGTHQRQDDEESAASYGKVYQDYTFVHHDCNDLSQFKILGTTSRGTEVTIRRDIASASFLLTFGAISHHYFAGYGGGRKLIFPGLGYKPSIYQNHSLFLDSATNQLAKGCKAGQLKGNPLAEDLAEVETFRSADLSIHGILNSSGQVCDLLVGQGVAFFHEACSVYGEPCEVITDRQYDLVIASCGGYPKDINFIQSHKAIHNSAAFVREGGHLIVYAACRDGVGSKTFLPWLEMGSYQAAFDHLKNNYEGNGGTALAMMEKSARIRISLVTELDDDITRTLGVDKATPEEVQKAVNCSSTPVAVIPNASLLVKPN